MRDHDVRQSLHRRLGALHANDADTRVINELDLCGQVRVDVAVLNGHLSGYELKSERDTLRRLPTQVELYSRVLDWATLVVAERHVEHARPLLPEWWGILVASSSDGTDVQLESEREAEPNPAVDPDMLVQLLWRDEALEELQRRNGDRGVRTKPRREIWSRLTASVSLPELQGIVRERLKAREGWRAAP